MKKGLILLGALPVALLTATFFVNAPTEKEGVYESRTNSGLHSFNSADGMMEVYHQMRGDYTPEMYARVSQMVDQMPTNRANMTWWEHGPDNVGGRCRAIVVDKDDINHVFAGSVSGGLFESFNRANFWQPVDEFNENLSVSSMCQAVDGTFYVATGHSQETTSGTQNAFDTGGNGNGLYKRNSDGTFTLIAGTEAPAISVINEVVCDTLNNLIWFATNQGLKTYDPVLDQVNNISNGLPPSNCNSLSISKDGTLIVASFPPGKTWVSLDGGASFLDMTSSTNSASPIAAGAGRIEYAISHERADNGNYYVYASCANQFLAGVWMSENNGVDWTQIAPANNQQPGSFAPFTTGGGSSGQGLYNNIISVQKGNPKKCFLGGIDTYSWSTTGNWTQLSQWFLPPQSPQYVHADNHEMYWDQWGRLYIGNDGGVQISDDGGQTFFPANRGFNVTQFYAIGASAHGDVIGGTQDNGTQANYHDNSTWHEFEEVGGGDGFSAEISFINRDLLFTSIYYSFVARSSDRGGNSSAFIPTEFSSVGLNNLGCNAGATDGSGCGQFFTQMKLWENPNDLNSTDMITYVPSQAYTAGDNVQVPSATAQTFIDYTTPIDLLYDDTVCYDPAIVAFDTLVTSTAPSTDYNLEVLDYTIVFGSHPLNQGDSIQFPALNDTIIEVDSYTLINHYYATNPLSPGDTIDLENDSCKYGVAWDTLTVQDPYQSWMAIGLGNGDGVWLTRNALRLSSPDDEWFKVNHSGISSVSCMEFSQDGDNLFIGTWGGQLYRLSGIGQIYSPEKDVDTLIDVNNVSNVANLATTWTAIHSGSGFGAPVTGIAVEADPTHVVITLGGYSGSTNGKVQETTDALGGSPGWSNAGGNLPNSFIPSQGALPCYSVVIVDPMTFVIGTDQGIFCTTDGGSNWDNVSGPVGRTPVFDMKINWRTWDEGCFRPGEIYAGTHGRGIWSSEDFLNLPGQQDQLDQSKFVPNINIYPNPMEDQGTIAFELESNSNVNIQIFSLSGQMVKEINETNAAAGQNNITFGVADLPKGTYVVRLTAGEKVETSKFVKH